MVQMVLKEYKEYKDLRVLVVVYSMSIILQPH
jgi:hypothetical protein